MQGLCPKPVLPKHSSEIVRTGRVSQTQLVNILFYLQGAT